MIDVSTSQDQDNTGLAAADEQLLRELTERARGGGLRLTGEGGLLGKVNIHLPPGCASFGDVACLRATA